MRERKAIVTIQIAAIIATYPSECLYQSHILLETQPGMPEEKGRDTGRFEGISDQ